MVTSDASARRGNAQSAGERERARYRGSVPVAVGRHVTALLGRISVVGVDSAP